MVRKFAQEKEKNYMNEKKKEELSSDSVNSIRTQVILLV